MKARRFKNFIPAFLMQKIAEYSLLSICLAVQFYIGSRLPNPMEWGVFNGVNVGWLRAISGGLAVAFAFFLFTLYPVVTLAIVALCRKLLGSAAQNFLPLVSSSVSVAYVVFWVVITSFDFQIVPDWIVTAIMAAFIFVSSVALYPSARTAT